uniref:Uncharacterized protein n=1 Tax=Cacopsylla melanoneura TaxID=428564 RepID=A0A8D8S7Q1_9HEMI
MVFRAFAKFIAVEVPGTASEPLSGVICEASCTFGFFCSENFSPLDSGVDSSERPLFLEVRADSGSFSMAFALASAAGRPCLISHLNRFLAAPFIRFSLI